MKVTFISNYINHHQIPFSNAMYQLLGKEYHFIQTQPMERERLSMGWDRQGEELPYVLRLYEQEEQCRKLVAESDVLLAGWSGREDFVQGRLAEEKLTIRISERLYREGQWKAVSPRGLMHKYQEHIRYRNSQAYLLCAGAYVPSDFHLIRAYPDKMFKWGYFPETRHYTPSRLKAMKRQDGLVHLVWAGRFIPLKHPEYMVQLAEGLQQKGLAEKVHIHMAGGGELEEEIRRQVQNRQLTKLFTFYGFQTPEQVRALMEQCHIHIFTSNHLEGWGAVVNEAMNSGCAEVANVQAGAVPYLLKQGENGLAYPRGSYQEMENRVCYLIEHPKEREQMGLAAYETITGLWNGECAAKRLLEMAEGLLGGSWQIPEEGPLSRAPVIAPSKMFDWMSL